MASNNYETFKDWADKNGWLMISEGVRYAFWVSPTGNTVTIAYKENGQMDYAELAVSDDS